MPTTMIIPTFDTPFYEQVTRLAGREFRLKFRYSQLTDRWHLGIFSVDGVALVEGIKLVTGANLLMPYSYNPALPFGALWVIPQGSDDSPPGLHDLIDGGRCFLAFIDYTV